MGKKFLAVLALALFPVLGMAGEFQIQRTVKAFYTWYISYSPEGRAAHDDKIFDYVDAKTVKNVRASYEMCDGEPCPCSINHDYFLKAQDSDDADWLKSIKVSKPLLSNREAVVFVVIGTYDAMRLNLVVLLRKSGSNWKIVDVVDAKADG